MFLFPLFWNLKIQLQNMCNRWDVSVLGRRFSFAGIRSTSTYKGDLTATKSSQEHTKSPAQSTEITRKILSMGREGRISIYLVNPCKLFRVINSNNWLCYNAFLISHQTEVILFITITYPQQWFYHVSKFSHHYDYMKLQKKTSYEWLPPPSATNS